MFTFKGLATSAQLITLPCSLAFMDDVELYNLILNFIFSKEEE